MKKFEKLSRSEMKKISGGGPPTCNVGISCANGTEFGSICQDHIDFDETCNGVSQVGCGCLSYDIIGGCYYFNDSDPVCQDL